MQELSRQLHALLLKEGKDVQQVIIALQEVLHEFHALQASIVLMMDFLNQQEHVKLDIFALEVLL